MCRIIKNLLKTELCTISHSYTKGDYSKIYPVKYVYIRLNFKNIMETERNIKLEKRCFIMKKEGLVV